MVAAADQRAKLERLCRYSTRPAVSTERLSLTAQGPIHYRLKTPYRDGTTHVVFEPLDFIARLAALVPSPRVNLTRYHGVFAPPYHLREQMKVIASIEDPAAIKRILAHLDHRQGAGQHPEHPPRAPPQLVLPGLLD